jgi:hypothetical protein
MQQLALDIYAYEMKHMNTLFKKKINKNGTYGLYLVK